MRGHGRAAVDEPEPVAWRAVLPVLPARTFAGSPWAAIGEDQVEMIGWDVFTAHVAQVVDEHDAGLVLTGSYGDAGALEVAGPRLGPCTPGCCRRTCTWPAGTTGTGTGVHRRTTGARSS